MEKELKKFSEFNLSKNVAKSLEDNGYITATEIQERTIPTILEGKDLIGQSQTGTGKTASFGIPMIEKIDQKIDEVQAIILCPTRELAVQVADEMRKFTKYSESIKMLAIYGGQDITRQIASLKRGVKIVIGTPGRVMDHMRRKTLKLDNVKMVVLDEADEMLNMGFEEDIETILKDIPKDRQTILFSATMNPRIMKITKKYLNDPVNIKIQAKELTVEDVEQVFIDMKRPMKDESLMRIIDHEQPKKAIVFCNTKKKVDLLIDVLRAEGYKAESLHGDVKQAQRERIMKKLKSGEFQILAATDVVARGIDIEDLDLVINYDVPQEEEYYVHRIGRTGRNGNKGKSITFVVGKEKSKLFSIQRYANTKIKEGKTPTIKEVAEVKNKKIISNIQKVIDKNEFKHGEILEELLQNNDIEKITNALLTMYLGKNTKKEVTKISNYNSDSKGNVKLFFNVGKKDQIMVKDIVGSISSNTAVSGRDLGNINILDKFSFVEVQDKHVEEIMHGMKDKQIKGRNVNIEIANNK